MKFLKIKDDLLDSIHTGKVNSLPIIDDQDNLTIDGEIEFFNSANVVFGLAKINQISIKRLGDIQESDPELIKLISTQRTELDNSTPVKIIHFDYQPYAEPKKIGNSSGLDVSSVKIFADGGSRGNPGPSASGYVILTEDDDVIQEEGVYLGITTNNQAEYKSIKFALEDALKLGAKHVDVYMDSLLVINQVNGSFKVKNLQLLPIYNEVKNLATKFDSISFTHVPRALNKLADAEVNKCLDNQQSIV